MPLEAVLFDWAGTTIDYGSRAPLLAFQQTFAHYGISLSDEEIRRDMGLDKMVHIRQLLKTPDVAATLATILPTDDQGEMAATIFARFKRTLLEILPKTVVLKPGVRALVDYLDLVKIPYGTTSGYDADMIGRILPLANVAGYHPRVNVTSEMTAGIGRPDPAMNRLAMAQLDVSHPSQVLIVGDTINDIKAALAAGAQAVGIIEGSNLLAYSKKDWHALDDDVRAALKERVRIQYEAAGADLIVDDASELLRLLQQAHKEEVTA
ncbi:MULTISPECIES: phosphonoacetaldehyde hydrolase [Lacticaseibacillus]|uniref:Phosphonoacetaldehyde hydrolase n=2 Tax=Lacticaseibacillus TaxID=2759736 RepID=A0ABW4CJQ8_9LACO|nr:MULTISPECIES: phosphonoacetaldehyde hydrolase [Lacticaseibacillus]